MSILNELNRVVTDPIPYTDSCKGHDLVLAISDVPHRLFYSYACAASLAAIGKHIKSVKMAAHGRSWMVEYLDIKKQPAVAWFDGDEEVVYLPDGKVDYALPLLAIGEAIIQRSEQRASELLTALEGLADSTVEKESYHVAEATGTLTVWVTFKKNTTKVRLQNWQVANSADYLPPANISIPVSIPAFLGGEVGKKEDDGFIGAQKNAVLFWLDQHEPIMFGGPTGTGKTFLTNAIQKGLAKELPNFIFEKLACMPHMDDADMLGQIDAYVNDDGEQRMQFVDGPITRVFRHVASGGNALLFLDEFNRLNPYQQGIFLTLIDPQDGASVSQMEGAPDDLDPDTQYYVLRSRQSQELLVADVSRFKVIAAGNFGQGYATRDIGLAILRRFAKIDFFYLGERQERKLIENRVDGISKDVSRLVASVATHSRRLMESGDLMMCIDTSSALRWAKAANRVKKPTIENLMLLGASAWGHVACGVGKNGVLNFGDFNMLLTHAIQERGSLSVGDTSKLKSILAPFHQD